MLILQVLAWFILGWLAVGLIAGFNAANVFRRFSLTAALVVIVGMLVGLVLKYFGTRLDIQVSQAASVGYSVLVAAIGLLAGYGVAERHKNR